MVNIEEIKKDFIEKLRPLKPEKIILFGSYVYGTPEVNSDLDLYIVTKDNFIPKTWKEKSQIFLQYARVLRGFQKIVAIDLITHTKPMHNKFIELNSSFAQEILNNGEVIYES